MVHKYNLVHELKKAVEPMIPDRDKRISTLILSCNTDDNGLPSENLFISFGKPSDKLMMIDLMMEKLEMLKDKILEDIEAKTGFFSVDPGRFTQTSGIPIQTADDQGKDSSQRNSFMDDVKALF